MMKNLNIIFLLIFLFALTGCNANIEPIEGIDIDSYELLYEDGFEIYILKDIPEFQYPIGIVVEELKDKQCFLTITTENAYIVKYENKYISLKNGVELNLFDTNDLIEYGVLFECHER